jgi:hypothetical protein
LVTTPAWRLTTRARPEHAPRHHSAPCSRRAALRWAFSTGSLGTATSAPRPKPHLPRDLASICRLSPPPPTRTTASTTADTIPDGSRANTDRPSALHDCPPARPPASAGRALPLWPSVDRREGERPTRGAKGRSVAPFRSCAASSVAFMRARPLRRKAVVASALTCRTNCVSEGGCTGYESCSFRIARSSFHMPGCGPCGTIHRVTDAHGQCPIRRVAG